MVAVSFEFFPPKSEAAEAALWQAVERLRGAAPAFVSVTYGAGGSTRERTHSCVRRLVDEGLAVAAHLTCVGAPRADIDSVIADYAAIGVKHIVAIRGDMPNMEAFVPHADGYQSSVELVAAIAAAGDFEISVSAYPEGHPESASAAADVALLREKIAAGASRAISQFVFDMEIYLRFRDELAAQLGAEGIEVNLVPAIMPTTNFAGVQRMAARCGASVPVWLADKFAGLEDDLAARKAVACEVAIAQCETLLAAGVEHIHFYTLNQADITQNVCEALSLGGAA